MESQPQNSNQADGGLLTVREAVDFVRLSRSDLYARMERGELAYCKLGRRRFLFRQALIDIIDRGTVACRNA